MNLYAFDRDDTVTTSRGPVPLELIKQLKDEGHIVVAIGNLALCSEAGIESGALGDSKNEHLRLLKERHPNCDRYVVVDNDEVREGGWEYHTPQRFMEIIQKGRGTL